jgi:hypothetical protein
MPNTDLANIPSACYPAAMFSPLLVTDEEMSSVIEYSHHSKAVGSDGIPFFLLKCLESNLVSYFQPLFLTCI